MSCCDTFPPLGSPASAGDAGKTMGLYWERTVSRILDRTIEEAIRGLSTTPLPLLRSA